MMPETNREPIRRSLLRTLCTWNPQPIPVPTIDPGLGDLPAIVRAAEVLSYRALKLEYALSPSGVLRELLKLCARILLILFVPTCLLIPPLVFIATGVADLTAEVVRACVNVLKAVLVIGGIMLVGSALIAWLSSGRRR